MTTNKAREAGRDKGKGVTRREVIKKAGLAALGLAFVKPLIQTIRPEPVLAASPPPAFSGPLSYPVPVPPPINQLGQRFSDWFNRFANEHISSALSSPVVNILSPPDMVNLDDQAVFQQARDALNLITWNDLAKKYLGLDTSFTFKDILSGSGLETNDALRGTLNSWSFAGYLGAVVALGTFGYALYVNGIETKFSFSGLNYNLKYNPSKGDGNLAARIENGEFPCSIIIELPGDWKLYFGYKRTDSGIEVAITGRYQDWSKPGFSVSFTCSL